MFTNRVGLLPSIAIASMMAASVSSQSLPQTELLRLHGSNTVGAELAPALIEAYAASRGWRLRSREQRVAEERTYFFGDSRDRLQVEVQSHGTNTGFRDLLEGHADLWMASRPVRPAERDEALVRVGALDSPAQEHVIALDGLAIVVHPDNPVSSLSVAQLRDLFAGRTRNWNALGGPDLPVRLYARDDRSGTYDSFAAMVLAGARLSDSAQRFESNTELSGRVALDPGGVGFVGVAAVGRARAVQVADGGQPMAPSILAVATEDYPLSRRLYLYSGAETSPTVRTFLAFAQSDAGQAVVAKVGYFEQSVRAVSVPPRSDTPDEYRSLLNGARRLSMNVRFAERASFLDGKALWDLDRVANFMRAPENRGYRLALVGFSDANESVPLQAIAISQDRADYVAQELVRRGVTVYRVRGMGQSAPVAGNDSAYGRYRNRRVEFWVSGDADAVAAP